jgi:hypothetical protein
MFADRMGLGLRHQELLDMRAGRSPCSRGRAQAVTDHSSEVSAAPHAWTDHHSSNFSKRLCPWIRREGNGIAPSSRRGAPPSPPKPALGRLGFRPLSYQSSLRCRLTRRCQFQDYLSFPGFYLGKLGLQVRYAALTRTGHVGRYLLKYALQRHDRPPI